MNWHAAGWAAAITVAVGVALRSMPFAKVVLWSPMTGRVLTNGRSAAGATLQRDFLWHFRNEKGSDRTIADANGAFSLPAIERASLLAWLLPHEPVIRQVMTVLFEGQSHNAWACFKHSYENNGEREGRPIDVIVHLERERSEHGEVMGLCEFP